MEISDPIATIVGATIGILGVIVGGLLTVLHQRGLERDRVRNARQDAVSKELASAVQQLTTGMAASLHSMCWLTWRAKSGVDELSKNRIDKYDDEQHAILPQIWGQLAAIAAVDKDLYESLNQKVREIFAFDGKIGIACLSFRSDPQAAAKQLADLYDDMYKLEDELPMIVGDLVGDRLRNPDDGT